MSMQNMKLIHQRQTDLQSVKQLSGVHAFRRFLRQF